MKTHKANNKHGTYRLYLSWRGKDRKYFYLQSFRKKKHLLNEEEKIFLLNYGCLFLGACS